MVNEASNVDTMVLATAMMTMLAERKRVSQVADTVPQEEQRATTNTISPEEKAEMERAPRAYRRRQMKALGKMKP